MLGEGFLRLLQYKEEKKLASAHKLNSISSNLQTDSAEAGPSNEELDSTQCLVPQSSDGLPIHVCSSGVTQEPHYTVYLGDCSLLKQYSDLRVAEPGSNSTKPVRTIIAQHSRISDVCQPLEWPGQQQGEPGSMNPDQGYLVMGASIGASLDLPGLKLEPMSNSLLNGLLDKQLDEVYMQHLTENLARCSSNSLLHGLVPPPQPSSQLQGLDSMGNTLEEALRGDSGEEISYLSTGNIIPYSSNFSSPVLRISETESTHQK